MIVDPPYCRYFRDSRRLCFDLRRLYGAPWAVFRLRSWEEGLWVDKREAGCWRRDEAAFDYVLVSEEISSLPTDHPLRAYHDTIPGNVADLAKPFRQHQLRVMQALAAYPQASDLALQSPLIFWIAASLLPGAPGSKDVVTLFSQRRASILERFFGHGSRSLVRFFGKLRNPTFEPRDFTALKKLKAVPEVAWNLRHLPAVDWALLRFLLGRPELFRFRAVRELLRNMPENAPHRLIMNVERLLRDVLRLGEILRRGHALKYVETLPTMDDVAQVHERWSVELNATHTQRMIERYGDDLPKPPFPGTDLIFPITTVTELLEEGRTMQHCVGSYIETLRESRTYIYTMTKPERATVEIHRLADGKVRLGQCKLSHNRQPSQGTMAAVNDWIASINQQVIRVELNQHRKC